MSGRSRFLALQVIDPHYHQEWAIKDMAELEKLVETFGGQVVERSVQHRVKPHPATYIGSGKVEWVKNVIKDKKIDVVVVNGLVKSGQLFRLEKTFWEVNKQIAVWDRVDLILNIFDQHASTAEAKLQIELARIQHQGPRIYGLGKTELSRQAGGIGTRGKGETNIEKERRMIKKRTQDIKKELKKLAKTQKQRINNRKQRGMTTVALVGYTSAGKTTLFNALTNKSRQQNAALFTTLDSVVGKLKISPHDPTVLISDTIGFINDLPPILIEAFRSTLLESLAADILLHVVDATDPDRQQKIDVVNDILIELGVDQPPVLVFNKIDRLDEAELQQLHHDYADDRTFYISAQEGEGLDQVKQFIGRALMPEARQ